MPEYPEADAMLSENGRWQNRWNSGDTALLIGLVLTTLLSYVLLVQSLNQGIVIAGPDFLDSVRGGVYPKPLEIPIYLLGWVFVPVLSVLGFLLVKRFCRSECTEDLDARQYLLQSRTFMIFSLLAFLGLYAHDFGLAYALRLASIGWIGEYLLLYSQSELLYGYVVACYAVMVVLLRFGHRIGLDRFVDGLGFFLSGISLLLCIVAVRLSFELLWFSLLLLFLTMLVFLETWRPPRLSSRNLIIDLGTLVMISYLVLDFHPSYMWPDTYKASALLHYVYILGPVNDVLQGKTLLVDAPSQYGLFFVYSIALVFVALQTKVTFANLAILHILSYVIGYSLIYGILVKCTKNRIMAVAAILFIIEMNYFACIDPQLAPQIGFLRFGAWIPITLLLMFRFNRGPDAGVKERFAHLVILGCVGIATFWGLDVGVYILGAYLVQVLVAYPAERFGSVRWLKRALHDIVIVLITVLCVFVFVQVYTCFRSGQWPRWEMFVADAFLYGTSGFGMLPTPFLGPYYALIVIYFIAVMWILIQQVYVASRGGMKAFTFLTVYGVLQLVYYLGRSHPNNLHHVFIPAVIVGAWLLAECVRRSTVFFRSSILIDSTRLTSIRTYTRASSNALHLLRSRGVVILTPLCLIALILASATFSVGTTAMIQDLANRKDPLDSFATRDDLQCFFPEGSRAPFLDTVEAIRQESGSSRYIAIVSESDALYLIWTGKVNVVASNNLRYFLLKSQINALINEILTKKPLFLYVDHEESERVSLIRQGISTQYRFLRSVGGPGWARLDIYVLRNSTADSLDSSLIGIS